MAADWLARAGVLARRHPAAIAAALALVTSLGAWVYSGVRSALVDLAAANLHWLADSESMAVRTWIGEKQLNVVRWARDPRVSEVAEQLIAAAHRGEDALRQACTGEAGARLVQLIDALRLEEAAAAIHLIDRDGRVLAARDTGKCAMQVAPALRAAFEPALQGRPQFAASRFEAERIGVLVPADAPKIWISAPVRDGAGEVIAALDIGKPADERFARLFAAAGIGATGESYAFDGRGMLLTESRLREALVERGALRPGESAVLRQRLDARRPTARRSRPASSRRRWRGLTLRRRGCRANCCSRTRPITASGWSVPGAGWSRTGSALRSRCPRPRPSRR